MTRKLYDLDSHLCDFSATVLRCDPDGERYAVVLDQTVFFPEGGGQPADTGVLGGARVLDVQLLPDGVDLFWIHTLLTSCRHMSVAPFFYFKVSLCV